MIKLLFSLDGVHWIAYAYWNAGQDDEAIACYNRVRTLLPHWQFRLEGVAA
jgi:hypothetical protein